MDNINIYNSGIQGYTIKGDIGEDGDKGYNLYFSTITDENIITEYINNNKTLSDTIDSSCFYDVNDIIIDSAAKMYVIEKKDDMLSLLYSGNIINQTEADDSIIDFSAIDCSVQLTSDSSTQLNIYHINNIPDKYKYYKYNELCESHVEGYELKVDINNKVPNVEYRLCINHLCGLTQEFLLDETNTLFIEKKYVYLTPLTDGFGYNLNFFDYIKKYGYIDAYNKTINNTYRFSLNDIL
jgi:hypothetical protein